MHTNTPAMTDPHAQLRALYKCVIDDQDRFDELKQLLAEYPLATDGGVENAMAAAARERLNARLRAWVGASFSGLSATQVSLWRGIIVDERINVAISPWKESNAY